MLSKPAGHREHTNMKRVPSVLGMDTWCFDGVRQRAWAGLGSGILNSEQEMCPDSEWCHLLSEVCQSRSIVAPQGLAQSLEHSVVVQSLSRSVLSKSWWPHGLQYFRLPCSSLFLEFTQTHVHWVNDAIQPPHPVATSPPALNLSQHQGLFQWADYSYQVAKVLEFQHQSFQWLFRVDFL